MLGDICKMVQLTGANLSEVVWLKTTVDLEVFELGGLGLAVAPLLAR